MAGILLKISKHFMFMKVCESTLKLAETFRQKLVAMAPNFGFIIFDSQEAVEKALKAKVRLNSSLYPVVSFVLFFSADNFVRKPPP